MNQQVKKKLFQIMNDDLEWNVSDNMEISNSENRDFPQVFLQTSHSVKDIIREAIRETCRFKIHIFSTYEGEKEILDMEDALINKLVDLYDLDGVVYVRESGFRVIADKSTGVEMKHGIISLTVYCAGLFKEGE